MLLIGNGTVVTRNATDEIIKRGAVLIEGQTIVAVGEEVQLKKQYDQYEYIDAQGGLIMPGYINLHHHTYSAFARGLNLPGNVPHSFLEILEGTWWRLDRHLTRRQVSLSAKATFVDCIKKGVTTVFDHHASYGHIEGSLFEIGEVAQALGIRACLAYEVSDRAGKEKMKAAVRENKDFIEEVKQNHREQLCGMMGLHASFTLSEATLDYVKAQKPKEAGYHIHVAEGLSDALHCKRHYGKSIVKRLEAAGILGPRTLAAHCIHIEEDDFETLKQTDTMVVHNPESNMGNAVGAAAIKKFFEKEILIGLGTDGYTSDLLESMKVAGLLQKHEMKDPSVGEAPLMLFNHNREMAQRFFERPLGVLEKGAYGDVIVVDYKPITPLTAENINSHLLFGVCGAQTKTTIIGGQVLMQDGKLLHIDEEALSRQCQEAAYKLWQSL